MRPRVLILLLLVLLIILLMPGCTGETITTTTTGPAEGYKLYEMKADDIRLEFLNHPLFSFEYPDIFSLVDLNNIPGHPMTYHISDTYFLYRPFLPEQWISIRVEEPGLAYNDASEKFKDYVASANETGRNITLKKIVVSGITTDYLEAHHFPAILLVEEITKEGQYSIRSVVFEYSNLIWEIYMKWYYIDSEPPEVQEYFDHIIETFKIFN